MNVRRLICLAITILSGLVSSLIAAPPKGIVVFIADDQSQADVGCYGNPVVQTRHIDQLAAGGIRFTNAFLTTSSCSPSRASILTGRFPHSTHAEDLHTPLPADQKTVSKYLRGKGWYTAAIGKWHLGEAEKKNWDAVVNSPPEKLAAITLETFALRDKSKPFFLWVASTDPHRDYQPGAFTPAHEPDKVIVPPFLPDDPRVREELAYYYDEIARFDAQVGKVVAALEQEGIADDTLFVYLTDNGMPFSRSKTTLYDSGIRTPYIWQWKNELPVGRTCTSLTSTVDFAPTLLELVGIRPDATMEGHGFSRVLRDPDKGASKQVFAEANWHDYDQFSRAVRTPRFKLIRNYYWDKPLWSPADSVNSATWKVLLEWHAADKLTSLQAQPLQEKRAFEEFYDLEKDPLETTNLIDDAGHREQVWELRAALDNWRVETEDLISAHRRPEGFTREGKKIPLFK